MRIKSIANLGNISGKKILLRLDLNVPIKNNRIKDDYKIACTVKTIKFLLKKNAKIIIISHLGRPAGKHVESLSLKPVARRLEKFINKKIEILENHEGFEVEDRIARMNPGDVFIMENIRFHPGEDKIIK